MRGDTGEDAGGGQVEIFYRKTLACPTCNKKVEIMEMDVSPSGKIHFELICVTCGKECHYDTDVISLVAWAIKKRDVELCYLEGNELVN